MQFFLLMSKRKGFPKNHFASNISLDSIKYLMVGGGYERAKPKTYCLQRAWTKPNQFARQLFKPV